MRAHGAEVLQGGDYCLMAVLVLMSAASTQQ